MEPDYHDGDNVIFSQILKMNHSKVGIFVMNGKNYIKEYREMELISCSADLPDTNLYEYDNIVCVRKIIEKLEEPYETIRD